MTNYYTENLSDFGFREIQILRDTLNVWVEKGLPDNFSNSGVKPAMNRSSGYVFLVNEDYQTAMLNGEDLEIHHFLPFSGQEGFLSDLVEENNPKDLPTGDVEYIQDCAVDEGFELTEQWFNVTTETVFL